MAIDDTLENHWNKALISQTEEAGARFFYALDSFSRAEERIRICLKKINLLPSLFSSAANLDRSLSSADMPNPDLASSMELVGWYDRDEKSGDYYRVQVERNLKVLEDEEANMRSSLDVLKEVLDNKDKPLPEEYRDRMVGILNMWQGTLDHRVQEGHKLAEQYTKEKSDSIDFTKPQGYSHNEDVGVYWHDGKGLGVDQSVSNFLSHISANDDRVPK